MQLRISKNAAQHDRRMSAVSKVPQVLVLAGVMISFSWATAHAERCADIVHQPANDVAHQPSADVSADSATLPTQPFDLAIPLTRDVVRDGRLLGRAPVASLDVAKDGAVRIDSPVIGNKPVIVAPCKPEVSTPSPPRR